MSLATRCTQCGTVFRVARDQLKVSEGWVRCGRCGEVFSALDGLFDLESETPPPLPASAARLSGPWQDERGKPAAREEDEEWADHRAQLEAESRWPAEQAQRFVDSEPARSEATADDAPVEPPFRDEPAPPFHDEPEPVVAQLDAPDEVTDSGPETVIGGPVPSVDFADARHSSELLIDPDQAASGAFPPGTAEAEAAAIAAQTRPAPAFVRHAESRQRWSSPAARAGQFLVALILASLLGLQYVHHERDRVAARWPNTQPALEEWCHLAGCTLQAPRQLADVHIESSQLTPAGGTAGASEGAVRLSVVLRNHGETKVMLPSLDVTLTDNAGRTVSRRALGPADFGITDPVLRGGAESTLQAVLDTGDQKAAGYTVDIFYP